MTELTPLPSLDGGRNENEEIGSKVLEQGSFIVLEYPASLREHDATKFIMAQYETLGINDEQLIPQRWAGYVFYRSNEEGIELARLPIVPPQHGSKHQNSSKSGTPLQQMLQRLRDVLERFRTSSEHETLLLKFWNVRRMEPGERIDAQGSRFEQTTKQKQFTFAEVKPEPKDENDEEDIFDRLRDMPSRTADDNGDDIRDPSDDGNEPFNDMHDNPQEEDILGDKRAGDNELGERSPKRLRIDEVVEPIEITRELTPKENEFVTWVKDELLYDATRAGKAAREGLFKKRQKSVKYKPDKVPAGKPVSESIAVKIGNTVKEIFNTIEADEDLRYRAFAQNHTLFQSVVKGRVSKGGVIVPMDDFIEGGLTSWKLSIRDFVKNGFVQELLLCTGGSKFVEKMISNRYHQRGYFGYDSIDLKNLFIILLCTGLTVEDMKLKTGSEDQVSELRDFLSVPLVAATLKDGQIVFETAVAPLWAKIQQKDPKFRYNTTCGKLMKAIRCVVSPAQVDALNWIHIRKRINEIHEMRVKKVDPSVVDCIGSDSEGDDDEGEEDDEEE